jgi:hypothetical protein
LKIKELPSQKYLNECFSYNQLSGLLKWKERPRNHFVSDHAWKRWNTVYSGTYAGVKMSGYIGIGINGIRYKAHRLIWKLKTGKDPISLVDHINLIESDNSWKNLREATSAQNIVNSCAPKNNHLGVKGVHKTKFGYMARLCQKSLGTFKTAEEAKDAYDQAAILKYGDFARS